MKRTLDQLVAESIGVRATAQRQPPEFRAWTLRVDLLAGQVGGLFGKRIAEALDSESDSLYWERIREHNSQSLVADYNLPNTVRYEWVVDNVVGLLQGLKRAVHDGLLESLEDRVASDIYTGVLEEASQQQKAGKLDFAAILMRVALENGLRRLARREGMPDVDDAKATVVNNWLWKGGQVYPRGTYQAVEGWLAIGNAFVHNTPDAQRYTHADVAKAIDDVRGFLGTHGL